MLRTASSMVGEGHAPLLHQLLEMVVIRGAHHFHVHARAHGLERGLGGIRRVPMPHHFGDGFVVAHHDAVELPLVAQHLAQRELVAAGGHAVQSVEGGHEGGRAGLAAAWKGGR